MDERALGKVPVVQRRGVWTTYQGGRWYSALAGGGIERVKESIGQLQGVERIVENVGQLVLDDELPAPQAHWFLLVKLVGSPWVHVVDSRGEQEPDWELGGSLARQAGLQVLETGHEDTSGVTMVRLWAGDRILIDFVTAGEDFPRSSEGELMEGLDPESLVETPTTFTSDRHPKDWWRRFRCVEDAHQQLFIDLDAYCPNIRAYRSDNGIITLDAEHGDVVDSEFIERVDLVVGRIEGA